MHAAPVVQRRASREVSMSKQSLAGHPQQALPNVCPGGVRASGSHLGIGGAEAALLPSLSIGSSGPRGARYKPGVAPAEAAKHSVASPAKQSSGSNLPQVKNTLSRGVLGARPAGGLEARYGLGRRY